MTQLTCQICSENFAPDDLGLTVLLAVQAGRMPLGMVQCTRCNRHTPLERDRPTPNSPPSIACPMPDCSQGRVTFVAHGRPAF